MVNAIGETTAARPQRVTDTYASPGDAVRNNYIGASVFLGAGVLLCLNGLLWTLLPWNRAPRSRYTPTYMPTYLPSDD